MAYFMLENRSRLQFENNAGLLLLEAVTTPIVPTVIVRLTSDIFGGPQEIVELPIDSFGGPSIVARQPIDSFGSPCMIKTT